VKVLDVIQVKIARSDGRVTTYIHAGLEGGGGRGREGGGKSPLGGGRGKGGGGKIPRV